MESYYDFVQAHPDGLRIFSCKGLLFLKMDCPPDFTKGDDWNELNCFLHILTGNKILHSREKSWALKKGDTIFLKKGAITIERAGAEPFCALMFFVPDKYIRSVVKEQASLIPLKELPAVPKDQAFPVHMTPVMTAYYESVIPYFFSDLQPAENLLDLKFRELLIHIISSTTNPVLTSYFYKLSQTSIADLQEIMESNCLYNLQLHEYARLCHRSLSAFKRDFHSFFGTSPGRWLLEKRLQHARHLLLHSSRPVLDVVMESGFTNISHFDRVFKKTFGVSPLQYRKHASTLVA